MASPSSSSVSSPGRHSTCRSRSRGASQASHSWRSAWRSSCGRPRRWAPPAIAGPYRWLRNPMYTVGYVQTYGLALLVASLPGLVAAVFSQGAIVAFYRLVERPHYQRLYGGVAATTARRLSTSRETG